LAQYFPCSQSTVLYFTAGQQKVLSCVNLQMNLQLKLQTLILCIQLQQFTIQNWTIQTLMGSGMWHDKGHCPTSYLVMSGCVLSKEVSVIYLTKPQTWSNFNNKKKIHTICQILGACINWNNQFKFVLQIHYQHKHWKLLARYYYVYPFSNQLRVSKLNRKGKHTFT
jgi:hypothetical protein